MFLIYAFKQVVLFSKWLFANIEGNSGVDISQFIKLETSEVELGDLPSCLSEGEKNYVETKFYESRQEMWDRLHQAMIPRRS